ncbi:hypothetical protein ACN6K5_007476 [Streptomyces violaceoruber]|uniref:hypothetical protein n=2 Tax=Streptomyces TaxID=1883 RepID=UPI0026D5AA4B|nr:hypothetical protein [Streptomyces anthocyanicus]WSB60304.1 hypothetical protein OIE72_08735 [Streptomyces anthocyanicus]
MSQHTSTWVRDSGVTVTGPGDVYIGTQLQDSDKPAFRRIAEDQLHRLRYVLVAPPRMGEARAVLADTGTVILDGAPGIGRSAAARVLLHEHHRDSGVFHELLPGEEEELSLQDPALVGTGDQLLLDLSAADDRRWAAAQADLPALRKAVHEQRAHLVVVMPTRGILDPDLQYCRVVLEQPPGIGVLRRHLRLHGVPPEQYLRPDGTVTGFLTANRPMREIAEFADLVRRAREAGQPGDGFGQWCEAAWRARNDGRREAAALVTKLREAPQRALMIAVSMLHGAHADVVHRAAEHLLSALGPPSEGDSPLQHRDLAERLLEISATATLNGQVRFERLDFDSAVRAHFWDHMPDLRPHLGTWAASVVELNDPHVVPVVRDGLVARVAGEYLRTGRADGLGALIEGWSTGGTSRPRLEAAVHALTCGLADPVHARAFREQIYQWCAKRSLKGELAQVLVRVCADVLATSHPDQALVRLYHLARRERGTTRARQALCELVARSRRLHRVLLDRLAHSDFSPANLGIFLQASDPELLTQHTGTSHTLVDEQCAQGSLTTCWHAVLADLPPPQWQAEVRRWFHWVAVDGGPHGGLLLDLLVSAAQRCTEKRGKVFALLYACARDAERTGPGDAARAAEITGLLLRKISAAQGIAPATPPTTSPGGTRP